jgi:hypothetical protein
VSGLAGVVVGTIERELDVWSSSARPQWLRGNPLNDAAIVLAAINALIAATSTPQRRVIHTGSSVAALSTGALSWWMFWQ